MIISFRADRSGQTAQTQIRLLLEEQSDQDLHCLPFHLHVFDKIPSGLLQPDFLIYCNDHKFSDRQVWANSADPDQAAPRGAV